MKPVYLPFTPNDISPQPKPIARFAPRRRTSGAKQSNGRGRRAALFGTLLVLHRRRPTSALLGLLPVEAIDWMARRELIPDLGRPQGAAVFIARVTAISWRRHAALKLMCKLYEKHAFVPERSVAEDPGSLGLPLLRQSLRLGDLRGRHFGSDFVAEFDRHGERWRARDREVEPHARHHGVL